MGESFSACTEQALEYAFQCLKKSIARSVPKAEGAGCVFLLLLCSHKEEG
jgi:hypothetical protein